MLTVRDVSISMLKVMFLISASIQTDTQQCHRMLCVGVEWASGRSTHWNVEEWYANERQRIESRFRSDLALWVTQLKLERRNDVEWKIPITDNALLYTNHTFHPFIVGPLLWLDEKEIQFGLHQSMTDTQQCRRMLCAGYSYSLLLYLVDEHVPIGIVV